jgi:hypothetical protein
MAGWIHCDQGACLKVYLRRLNRPKHNLSDGDREDILRTNLNHARASSLLNCKEHPEIKIVRENNPPVACGKLQDLGIGRAGLSHR